MGGMAPALMLVRTPGLRGLSGCHTGGTGADKPPPSTPRESIMDKIIYIAAKVGAEKPTIRGIGRVFGIHLVRNELLILHSVACRLTGRVLPPMKKDELLTVMASSVSEA